MEPKAILTLKAIQNIVDTEPLFVEGDNYVCVYCDFVINEDGGHDDECSWAMLRALWDE